MIMDQITADTHEFPKEWIGCIAQILGNPKHWGCSCGSRRCFITSPTTEVCFDCYNPNIDYPRDHFMSNDIQDVAYERITDKLVRITL